MRAWMTIALLCLPTAFGQSTEPTKEEIAQAYRSKSGSGAVFPGFRWETWQIKEIRGWHLRFHREEQRRSPGVLKLRYLVIAKNQGTCASYTVSETVPLGANPQIRLLLAVEPGGLTQCR